MRADGKWNKFFRFWLLLMWVLPLPGLVYLAIVFDPLPLCVLIIWSILIWIGLSFHKKVILTDEGIYAYTLFKNKIYPWEKVIQAGVLWRFGRVERYNEMILLKQGGSPRKYKDHMFLLRNIGKTIHMDASPEVHCYIRKHYGLLDYDLSDGQAEQSIVVD